MFLPPEEKSFLGKHVSINPSDFFLYVMSTTVSYIKLAH